MSRNIDVTNYNSAKKDRKLSRSISQPILIGLSSNLKQNNGEKIIFDVNSPLIKYMCCSGRIN